MVGGDADSLQVRTAPDGVDEAPMESWEMLPRRWNNGFSGPSQPTIWILVACGKYWLYCTTLIRKHQGEDRHWTVVEVSSKFIDVLLLG